MYKIYNPKEGYANLRKGPSVGYVKLYKIFNDESLEVLGVLKKGHYVKVRHENVTGYVLGDFVKPYEQSAGQVETNIPANGEPHTEHFKMSEWETRCKITDKKLYPILQALMNALEVFRNWAGDRIIKIHSGYRTKAYHKKLNPKSKNSMHCYAGAADISYNGDTSRRGMHDIGVLAKMLYDEGIIGGLGLGNSCVHIDMRGRKDANGKIIKYDNLRALWFYNGYRSYDEWFEGTK